MFLMKAEMNVVYHSSAINRFPMFDRFVVAVVFKCMCVHPKNKNAPKPQIVL